MKNEPVRMKQNLDRQLSAVTWTARDSMSVLDRMEKEEQPVKRKLSVSLIFALVLVLFTAAALAASMNGLLDVLDHSAGDGKTLPEASELIQSSLASTENDGAFYTVREAIYDGYAAYILVDITPKDPKVLLIPETYLPSDPTRGLIEDADAPLQTIADYAKANGYTSVAHVNTGVWGECAVRDSWQDNVITLAISFTRPGETLTLDFKGNYIPYLENDELDLNHRLDCETTFTLAAAKPNWELRSDDVLAYPEGGFNITSLKLTGTDMATYYEITYTITDVERYNSTHTHFTFMDADSNKIDSGVLMFGRANSAEQNGDVVVLQDSLVALTEKPDSIYLELTQPVGLSFDLE